MIAGMKKTIQKPMIKKQHRLHEARIASQTVPYDVWLSELLQKQEQELLQFTQANNMSMTVGVVKTMEDWHIAESADVILFATNPELLIKDAQAYVQKYMMEHSVDVFYADELHYFKPDFSPELLEASFYFGNVYGVRTEILKKIKTRFDNSNELIRECLKLTDRVGHLEDILYLGEFEPNITTEHLRITGNVSKPYNISVIIPSKDNPAVLSTCIHSLLENTDGLDEYFSVELIVVDNGSNDANRLRIEKMREQLQEQYRFRYFHQEMGFNFSHMCNLGAKLATGDYLLFLNDDIEIRDYGWLSKMMYQAVKPQVGAVGAKLLYPDGERIQHVGIANIHLGPAHKLQFASDKQMHYMGYNRCPVNVMGVTGACMLLKRECFEKTGGFDESLQVSFNDVELCFHLYSMGYRNVCCNHTYLYHHESLSRGADAGLVKVRRLHRERDYLYGKYRDLWNHDPYYSSKFVTDILDDGFETASRFQEKRMSEYASPLEITGKLDEKWYNQCLYMGIEFAGNKAMWIHGPEHAEKEEQEDRYYIQGWSYAVEVDNSRYKKKLLLKPVCEEESEQHALKGRLWEIPYSPLLRMDMATKLPYIERPELAGVSVWFDKSNIPEGEYLIGYLWEDVCSRQKLYAFTAETIMI